MCAGSLREVFVATKKIMPSPENDAIYGAVDEKDIDFIKLARDIAANGIREPIQVSADNFIVSGHRRHAAALACGLPSVPVRYINLNRQGNTATSWKRILRSYNHQRVKPAHVRLKESLLDVDPDLAHKQLIEARDKRDEGQPPELILEDARKRSTISERKREMLDAVIKVIADLRKYWPLSDRQIHYGLLNEPPLRNNSEGKQRSIYQNDRKSYGDLCDLLTRARLAGIVPWAAIEDQTRPVVGIQFPKDVAQFTDSELHFFLRNYRRDLMQSQSDHVELVVEKLTVRSIIEPIAKRYTIPMTVGRGYCSITPRHEIVQRFLASGKDRLKLLIASDFDPDGEAIAESFARSIRGDFGIADVQSSKILLREDQIQAWSLPPNQMEAKETSKSYGKFVGRYGAKQVYELEAVAPSLMEQAVVDAVDSAIDLEAFNAELENEKQDAVVLQKARDITASTLNDAFSDM